VRALPAASRRLAAALSTGTRTLDGSAPFADRLGGVFGSLGSLARQDATSSAVRQLIDTVDSVGTTLSVLLPAQLHCNIGGIWARNLQDTLAGGNSLGNYLNGSLLVSDQQLITGPGGAGNLNANPLPNENAQECESGHEPYRQGRHIGNPPGLQGTPVARTHPPAAATRAARAAGLLDHVPGASR
jgi:hypothetical protein